MDQNPLLEEPQRDPFNPADREILGEQESSGGNISDSSAADTENKQIQNQTGVQDGGWKVGVTGRKSTALHNKAKGLLNTRKKVALAAGGAGFGGVLILVLILFMLFASGFGIKQLAEVLRTANFSAYHLANYRRTTQYFVEESLNRSTVNGSGTLNSLGRRTVPELLSGFNVAKSLTNLGDAGVVKFNFVDNTTSGWIRTTTTSELKGVTIGKQSILVPQEGVTTKDFVKKVDRAISESGAFATESRWVRTKTANAIFEATGTKLGRWASAGRKIRTFKDAVLSSYEYLKTNNGISSSFSEVKETTADFNEKLPAALDDTGALSRGVGVTTGEQLAESMASKASKLQSFARANSLAAMFSTLYCGAVDYIGQQDKLAIEKTIQSQRAFMELQSASDQIAAGDVRANAVDFEAARYRGFENSVAYQTNVGVPDLGRNPPDLDSSEYPKPDTSSSIYKIFDGVKTTGDVAIKTTLAANPVILAYLAKNGGNLEAAIQSICSEINTPEGQTALLAAEAIVTATAAIYSGGTAAGAKVAAEEGAEQAVKLAFRQGMKKISYTVIKDETKKFAVNVAAMKGIDYVLGFLIERTQGTNSPALNDGETITAKSDMGGYLSANSANLAVGGRSLNEQEERELTAMTESSRLASLHKKSVWYRLASLENVYSPVSRFAVSYPTSTADAKVKMRKFAFQNLNPFTALTSATSKIASSASMSQSAFAVSPTKKYGIQKVAYSAAEMEKMLDPEFWPRANAQWVESGDRLSQMDSAVGSCFTQLDKKAELPPGCDEKLRSGTANFSADDILHYRLYLADGGLSDDPSGSAKNDYKQGFLGQLLDLQEIKDDTTTTSLENTGPLPTDTVTIAETDVTKNGGGIRVHKSIVSKLDSLLVAATGDGVNLTGGGWRDSAQQIELRKAHCGTSNYAIYEMPASSCDPPTARPGTSMHERGLAIDFSNCSRSSACFIWLKSNAEKFGFFNLPSESWHWSVNGS